MFDRESKINNSTEINVQTPKIKRINGLLTLSSSNKKKFCFKNSHKPDRYITIKMLFEYGAIRRDSIAKFIINIFQYILYDKNAIPIPFNYIDKLRDFFLKDDRKNGDLDAKSRLRSKLLIDTFCKLDSTFIFISKLFLGTDILIKSVALCLGDSLRFAKEIFIINLEKLNIDSNQEDKKPLITLRYMIEAFYKKLLNEMPDNLDNKSMRAIHDEAKAKNILFSFKIDSKSIDAIENFVDKNTFRSEEIQTNESIDFKFRISKHGYRIGSIQTKIINFQFGHHKSMMVEDSDFDIYLEDGKVEEIIEEKIIIDPINNALPEFDVRSNLESYGNCKSSTLPTLDNDINKLLDPPKSLFADDNDGSVWIQISPPIQCVNRI